MWKNGYTLGLYFVYTLFILWVYTLCFGFYIGEAAASDTIVYNW